MSLPTVQLALRPGIIDLSWGHPDPALLPVDAMRRATAAALAGYGADALAYGAERGPAALLEWLLGRIAATDGRAPAVEEVAVTGGASHALDQICTLWTRPGDVALVESPVYHLAVRILREHPLELMPVPRDHGGLRPDALAAAIRAARRAGRRPRLLYTVPTFHNPTGGSLAPERRRALVELCTAEEVLIIEDDVYRDLAYDGPPPPSLWSLDTGGAVARLGSFSKALAPGLRLGWLSGPAPLVARMVTGGLLDSGGGINHFTAIVVATLCAAGDFDAQVARLRAAYRARRDALAAALRAHLPPGCTMETPAGGFFVWVQLPGGIDAAALLPAAEAAGVSFLPGARFAVNQAGSGPTDATAALRLAFTLYGETDLREAARRLGHVVADAPRRAGSAPGMRQGDPT
jgi:DNA-binding transcriptional MocR family regulator